MAGLLGSGRSTLLRMLFGAAHAEAGAVTLAGQKVGIGYGVRTAMDRGIAFVPEDRLADAAFADTSVQANLSMAQVAIYSRLGRIGRRRERADARDNIGTFAIRPANPAAVFSTLSGGNQQKVVVARWLRRAPTLLLLDEPTQGVDVGARADIYGAVRKATGRGTAVVLVSSDTEELVHACDRVVVLHEGRITANIPRADLNRERLTHLTYSGEEHTS